MFERFTERGKLILKLAAEEAATRGHDDVDTVHVLLALLREPGGVAGHLLRFDGNMNAEQIIGLHESVRNEPDATLAELEVRCLAEAKFFHHDYVGTVEILVALCSDSRCRAARLLGALGIHPIQLCEFALGVLGHDDAWEQWRQAHPDAR